MNIIYTVEITHNVKDEEQEKRAVNAATNSKVLKASAQCFAQTVEDAFEDVNAVVTKIQIFPEEGDI